MDLEGIIQFLTFFARLTLATLRCTLSDLVSPCLTEWPYTSLTAGTSRGDLAAEVGFQRSGAPRARGYLFH